MPVAWNAIVDAVSDRPQAQFSNGSIPLNQLSFSRFDVAVTDKFPRTSDHSATCQPRKSSYRDRIWRPVQTCPQGSDLGLDRLDRNGRYRCNLAFGGGRDEGPESIHCGNSHATPFLGTASVMRVMLGDRFG
jgi:hypothetical protein